MTTVSKQHYDVIDKGLLEENNINDEQLKTIYENYRIYCKLLAKSSYRKNGRPKPATYHDKYHCEVCDKDVLLRIKWQHEHTITHIKKNMNIITPS